MGRPRERKRHKRKTPKEHAELENEQAQKEALQIRRLMHAHIRKYDKQSS